MTTHFVNIPFQVINLWWRMYDADWDGVPVAVRITFAEYIEIKTKTKVGISENFEYRAIFDNPMDAVEFKLKYL